MQEIKRSAIQKPKGLRRAVKTFRSNWELLLLCLPAMAGYLLFHYMPMAGIIMAFKNFNYRLGLYGSKWIGLKNFEFLFRSTDLWRIVRNTVGYSFAFMIIGPIVNITIALLLYEITSRRALKVYQTIMTFPNFMSMVIVGFITYAVLSPTQGVLNQLLLAMGMNKVDVYTKPAYWPFILTFVNTWKGLGMGSMMYFAALLGIDPALYEAAKIDGASRMQQVRHISLPFLIPLVTIFTILAMGNLFTGNLDLFYQIPRNVGMLYETTDVINTYVFRGLKDASFGMSSAVGLIQSTLGLVLVTLTNWIVSKISPDNAMF